MVRFIYDNDIDIKDTLSIQLWDRSLKKIERKEIELLLKFTSVVEDLHILSLGRGLLVITDGNGNTFTIYPSSGVVDIYYFLYMLILGKNELSYCLEELYTINQYDDEYCVSINIEKQGLKKYISLKNNRQDKSCSFDYQEFSYELQEFSQSLLDEIVSIYPMFIKSPIYIKLKDMINQLASI